MEEIVIGVGDLIKQYNLKSDITYQCNTIPYERVQKALELFCEVYQGEIWAKLDAGSASWFQRVDGTKFPFKNFENISWATKHSKHVVLQYMFHKFGDEEPSKQEIDLWSERVLSFVEGGGENSVGTDLYVARKTLSRRCTAFEQRKIR